MPKTKTVKDGADDFSKSVENLDSQKKTKVVDMARFIAGHQAQIDAGVSAAGVWRQNQLKWYKKRHGIRKDVTFPWKGASNLHLPLQDKTIRKFKPEYISVLWNVSPICNLEPMEGEALEVAEEASWHFDWMVRSRMQCFDDLCLLADKHLQKGFEMVKTVYEKITEPKTVILTLSELEAIVSKNVINPEDKDVFRNPAKVEVVFQALSENFGFDRTDTNDVAKMLNIAKAMWGGAEAVEFNIEQVTYDAPKMEIIDGEYITVPPETKAVFDLEQATWIDHRYYVTPSQLMAGGVSGKWDMDVVKEILGKVGITDLQKDMYTDGANSVNTQIETQTKFREGIQSTSHRHQIIIHQSYIWYDSDGDDREERHVLEYAEEYQQKPLRFIRYPYQMPMWPFVRVPFEVTDDGYYSSRGTVEIEDPIASALNVQHNQKINRQHLATTPTLLYAPGHFNPANMKFTPGGAVPVPAPVSQNAQYLIHPNVDGSFINEEMILKSWDEEHLATTDFGIASPASTGGAQKARSATEISQVSQNRTSVRSMDIQIWKAAFREICKRLWYLWMQYGPDKVYAYADSTGKVHEIYKNVYAGEYNFSPSGKFGVSDPIVEAQKAARRFEVLRGDPMINQYELYREMLSTDDPRRAKLLLKSKQQLQQEAMGAQQAAQQQEQKDTIMQLAGMKPKGASQPKGQASQPRPQQIGGGGQTGVLGG